MQTRFLLTLLALPVFLGQGVVRAQVPTSLPEEAPFTFGKVQLYPIYAVSVAWTDNLSYQSDQVLKTCLDDPNVLCSTDADCPGSACVVAGTGRIATTYASIAPGFVLDLPFSQSHSRIGYVLDYRGYTPARSSNAANVPLPSHTNHFFVGETALQFAAGGRLTIRDDFQRGTLSSTNRDPATLPGSVVDFTSTDDRFRANIAAVTLGHVRGTSRSIDLSLYSHILDFLTEGPTGYYDVNALGANLSGEHQLKPRFRLSWEMGYDESDLSGPDERSIYEHAWKVGGTWHVRPGSTLGGIAGWQQNRTRSGPGEDSRAFTGSLTYALGVPGGLQLSASVLRDVYTGVYGNNDSFLEDRVSVSLGNDPQARVVIGGRVSYFTDHFPVAPVRTDRTFDGEMSIGYRLGGWGRMRFNVRTTRRDSDPGDQVVQDFGYDVNTVGFTLALGE